MPTHSKINAELTKHIILLSQPFGHTMHYSCAVFSDYRIIISLHIKLCFLIDSKSIEGLALQSSYCCFFYSKYVYVMVYSYNHREFYAIKVENSILMCLQVLGKSTGPTYTTEEHGKVHIYDYLNYK